MMEGTGTYSCYYCNFASDSYKTIICHLCENHPERLLQYREIELDCTTGKLGRRTRIYENIRPVDYEISITSDNRLSVQNADRSKRKKTNTPKKFIEETVKQTVIHSAVSSQMVQVISCLICSMKWT